MQLRASVMNGILRCLTPVVGKELLRYVPNEGAAPYRHHLVNCAQSVLSPWTHQALRCIAQPAVAHDMSESDRIRDFAIIAHVDHGKTTLMDKIIFYGSGGTANAQDRVMDSGVFEKERGITITSKYTSFPFKGFTLNAVDTPGHADFGGEVERILGMVDGCLLVVDAQEGAMAQTKYVLGKALAMGLRPIVVLNKIDRPSATQARCDEVHTELFDLFATLGASDDQLDFPVLFASGREGWATLEYPDLQDGKPPEGACMEVLLDAIVRYVPPPKSDVKMPFSMLVTMLEHDNYLGRISTGRVATGTVSEGDSIKLLSASGGAQEEGKVTKIMKKSGLGKVTLPYAVTGDIVSVAGISSASIADTIAAPEVTSPLQAGQVDPPTLAMIFAPNDSPIGRTTGNILTSQKIIERLESEAAVSVSLKVRRIAEDAIQVEARGELQLGLLIESMRRDGFELQLSAPRILMKQDGNTKLEPIEEVTCEVPDDSVGTLISSLQIRKGVLEDMKQLGESGRTRLVFRVPARGLLGFRTHFTTITRGEGILNRAFQGYEEYRGAVDEVRKGALISMAEGKANAHAMVDLQTRGTLFVKDGDEVYNGMIVGESNTEGDMEVNPAKEKKLSNVRSKNADEKLVLTPPKLISLEDAIGYIQWDELIEVTPTALRLRKKVLNSTERKKFMRSNNELS